MADQKRYGLIDRLFGAEDADRVSASTTNAYSALSAQLRAQEQRRAQDIADAAQGAGTFKGDLVADELRAANEAKARGAAKVQAALEDKFGGPTIAEQESQARFIDTERAEIQRRATKSSKGLMVGPLSAAAMAFFKQRKE